MSGRYTENGMRVLVTGGDHTGSLAAVRALRAAGHEPWVGAVSGGGYAARSRAAAGVVALPYSGSEPAAFRDQLVGAFERLGAVASHETVLVQGAGPVGLYATAVARDRTRAST